MNSDMHHPDTDTLGRLTRALRDIGGWLLAGLVIWAIVRG